MKNELIEARLRRDKSLWGFLDKAENRTRYADMEDDVAPRRALLQTHLATADKLAQQVLGADEDNMPARKRGFRNQLTALLLRATRALRAHARSTSDTDLAGRLPSRPSDLTKLGETSFGEEARRLLDLAKPYDLTRRRYTAAHAEQAEDLLLKFTQGITDTRLGDTQGSGGRTALERLIKATARLKAELQEFFDLYKDDEDDPGLYTDFRNAARVVRRGGQEGPDAAGTGTPA